jgi:predicted transcriptional regulator
MATTATSLKLPALLKQRIDRLARKADETPHSLMVRALESQVEAMERHEAFRRDAQRADKGMERSGVGYESDSVHEYLRARVRGRKARRPKAVAWRD